MQNEITELRNQVRTLKRIVCGFGCLLIVGVVVAATSTQTIPDVIQAKRFEVLSADGKAVVILDSHILDVEVPLKEELHYGTITSLNSQGGTLVTLGANPCFGTGQLMTMNAHGRLLVKLGTEVQKLRYGVVGNGGLVETYQENGTLTSYAPSDVEQPFHDPYNSASKESPSAANGSDDIALLLLNVDGTPLVKPNTEVWCQHPHHSECSGLKALSSLPTQSEESCCHDPHHMECIVNTTAR